VVDTDWSFRRAYGVRREGDESLIVAMMVAVSVYTLRYADSFSGMKHFLSHNAVLYHNMAGFLGTSRII
jgi:hypothetical protein